MFRSLRLEAIVEPIRLIAELSGNTDNQRPDILIRNPRLKIYKYALCPKSPKNLFVNANKRADHATYVPIYFL